MCMHHKDFFSDCILCTTSTIESGDRTILSQNYASLLSPDKDPALPVLQQLDNLKRLKGQLDEINENSSSDNKNDEFTLIPENAQRWNKNKPRVDLLPPELPILAAKGYEFGIRKGYPERNCDKGFKYETTLASLTRHIAKFRMGEDTDVDKDLEGNEVSEEHVYLILWNAIQLAVSYHRGRIDLDDRVIYKELVKDINSCTTPKVSSGSAFTIAEKEQAYMEDKQTNCDIATAVSDYYDYMNIKLLNKNKG